ncbi:MAG: tetratricopeptide repeat protein [Scytolyngbya sp. HA4215-MV1]|nr:tetratricopeptide repeat protein [Scytolyngbya sp. HA4215-MV1]
MAEKRRRWMLNLVLIIAVIGLVGSSLFPVIDNVFRQSSVPSATSSALKTTESQKAELESQVKGYELVLQREPDNPAALEGLIRARKGLIDMGSAKVEDIIPPLERLVKVNPNDTVYAILLAQAKQYTKDYEGAAQVYRNILTTKPGDTYALKGMVDLLLTQNRPEQAIGLLQDTLKTANSANQTQPGSVDVPFIQIELGRVYASQKRYEESIALFDEAIKTNQQDFRPILGKALVLKEQGKVDAAKPLFVSAANLAPAQYKDEINKLAGSEPATTASPVAPSGAPAPATSPSPVPAPSSSPSVSPAPATSPGN